MPLCHLAHAVEPQEVACDVGGAVFGALLGARPLRAAQPAERGYGVAHADVARDAVELIGWDVELVRPGVVDEQILALDTAAVELHQPVDSTDAVVLMHDVIAWAQLRQKRGGTPGGRAPCRRPRA